MMPAEFERVDRLLDDDRLFAPYRPFFHATFGRPSIPGLSDRWCIWSGGSLSAFYLWLEEAAFEGDGQRGVVPRLAMRAR